VIIGNWLINFNHVWNSSLPYRAVPSRSLLHGAWGLSRRRSGGTEKKAAKFAPNPRRSTFRWTLVRGRCDNDGDRVKSAAFFSPHALCNTSLAICMRINYVYV